MTPGRDGALSRYNFLMRDRVHEALREMAHRERTSMSEIVRRALEDYEPMRPYLDEEDT